MLKLSKQSRTSSVVCVAMLLVSLSVDAADRKEKDAVNPKPKTAATVSQVPAVKPQKLDDSSQYAAPAVSSMSPNAGEQIRWQVISCGGNRSLSTNYVLSSTAGQTAVGAGSSTNYRLGHGFWQESRPAGCCDGRVGNANGVGTYPNEVTISDIQTLVTAKFITGSCAIIPCLAEADVNQSGGANPTCNDITISDIQTLVNHLFIAGPANAPLKSCL
jgi:hypothetical protein